MGDNAKNPKVSIVTSMYNGDAYIHQFLNNITGQTYFSECELIIIDADSPGNEKVVIDSYRKKYPNIIYKRLERDPGIYESWNIAIRMARGQYITNANLDDLRLPAHIERCAYILDQNPDSHVISTNVFVIAESESFNVNKLSEYPVWFKGTPEVYFARHLFEKSDQHDNPIKSRNIPHCCPVWRKAIHDHIGYFDEENYKHAADWEFWLRTAQNNFGFRHIDAPLAVYRVVENSHNRRFAKIHSQIQKKIVDEYYANCVNLSLSNIFDFNSQLDGSYGKHRSGWKWTMDGFRSFEDDKSGIIFSSFIERDFGWDHDINLMQKMMHRGWVGIAHAPHNYPDFVADIVNQKPNYFINESAYKVCWSRCLGMFTLSEYLANEYRRLLPGVTVERLWHPTEFVDLKFTMERFNNNPDRKIVQVGYWLRKLTSILKLNIPDYLRKGLVEPRMHIPHIRKLWSECRRVEMGIEQSEFSDETQPFEPDMRKFKEVCKHHKTEPISHMSDADYDKLLSENVVLLDVYDMSASNLIVECIVRNTPILATKHPAVVEYLGEGYPLYFNELKQASALLEDSKNIRKAHEYLTKMDKKKFRRDSFVKSIYNSNLYTELLGKRY